MAIITYGRTQDDAGTAAPTFNSLPTQLQLDVLLSLPLVERVRCALVSRDWAALLLMPAFWSLIDFDGAQSDELDDSVVLSLCRRAKGCLRSLDVSSPACENVQLRLTVAPGGAPAPLLGVLASEGLTRSLRSLTVWRPGKVRNRDGRFRLRGPADARALLESCPALQIAAVDLDGRFPDALASLSLLPPGGAKRLRLSLSSGTDCAALCADLSAALAQNAADKLEIIGQGYGSMFFLGAGGHAEYRSSLGAGCLVSSPAAQLGAALASPATGPRVFRSSEAAFGASAVLGHLCRSLCPQSPLRSLVLDRACVGNAGAALIAAALAPGGSRIELLNISGTDCFTYAPQQRDGRTQENGCGVALDVRHSHPSHPAHSNGARLRRSPPTACSDLHAGCRPSSVLSRATTR